MNRNRSEKGDILIRVMKKTDFKNTLGFKKMWSNPSRTLTHCCPKEESSSGQLWFGFSPVASLRVSKNWAVALPTQSFLASLLSQVLDQHGGSKLSLPPPAFSPLLILQRHFPQSLAHTILVSASCRTHVHTNTYDRASHIVNIE